MKSSESEHSYSSTNRISRVKLLAITAALIIISTWLPGGLLPQWAHDNKKRSFYADDELPTTIQQSNGDDDSSIVNSIDDDVFTNTNLSSTAPRYSFSSIKNTFRRDDATSQTTSSSDTRSRVAVADLRVDSKGMLLHPTCDSHNQSISSTVHALVHVRCSYSSVYINGQGRGGYFGIHGLHLASIRDVTRLFCGDISRAKIARQCLPILVKAIRIYQPSVYREFVRDEWNDIARNSGLSLCCTREEMRKPITSMNITNCGVPCTGTVQANSTNDEIRRQRKQIRKQSQGIKNDSIAEQKPLL